MEPRDNIPTNGQKQRGDYRSSEAWEHHIRTPLAVICGHVQLLQRRLDKGHVLSNDELRRTLGYIEQAARSIEAHLRARNDQARRPTDRVGDQ